MNIEKNGKCCLCGAEYHDYGCNPAPLDNDENHRCCHKCDLEKVIPARANLTKEKVTA